MSDSFGNSVPTSWTDWVSGDWLRRQTLAPPSMPFLEGSFGGMSRLWGGSRGTVLAMAPVLSPPALIERLLDALKTTVLGRLVSILTARAEISMVLDELRVNPTSLELALGHLGDMTASAHDVSWSGRRLDCVRVTVKNVHVHPGREPTLVAAPVELTGTVGQASLDGWLRPSARARLTLGDNTLTVAWRGRERWGFVELEPHAGGSEVSFVPRAVSVRSRRFTVPRHTPAAFTLRLPPLPRDLVVTRAEVREGQLLFTGVVPEIRQALDPARLQRLDRLARRGADRFDLRADAPADDHG